MMRFRVRVFVFKRWFGFCYRNFSMFVNRDDVGLTLFSLNHGIHWVEAHQQTWCTRVILLLLSNPRDRDSRGIYDVQRNHHDCSWHHDSRQDRFLTVLYNSHGNQSQSFRHSHFDFMRQLLWGVKSLSLLILSEKLSLFPLTFLVVQISKYLLVFVYAFSLLILVKYNTKYKEVWHDILALSSLKSLSSYLNKKVPYTSSLSAQKDTKRFTRKEIELYKEE